MSEHGCMFDAASIGNSLDDLAGTVEDLGKAMEVLITEVEELASLVETLRMNMEVVHQDVAKQGVVLNSLSNLAGRRRSAAASRRKNGND